MHATPVSLLGPHRRARRWSHAALACSVAALTLLSLTRSHAESAAFPLLIDYEGGEGCPSRDELESELRARDLPFRAPAPGEPATRLRLAVRAASPDSSGTLDVALLTGETTSRQLHGASCRDVVRSLTLVAALALAPIASPLPASPAPPASSPAPPASAPPRPAPPPSAAPAPAPPPPPRTATWSAGVEVALSSALGPRPTPGVSGWLDHHQRAWSARLALGYWPHGTTLVGPYEATFTAHLAALDACWPGVKNDTIELALCGGVQAGVLSAQGGGVDNPRSERRPWLAPRVGARASYLAGGARAEATLGLFAPIFRDSFFFEQPRVEVHRPGVIGVWGGVGGGFDLF